MCSFFLQKFIDVQYGMDYGSLTLQLKAELRRRNARLLGVHFPLFTAATQHFLSSRSLVRNLLTAIWIPTLRDTARWHCGKVHKMQKGDAIQQLKSDLQDSNEACFGKTADVRQVAIRLLPSRLLRITDARHRITFSFILRLTYVMRNFEWYGHVPYECHFL